MRLYRIDTKKCLIACEAMAFPGGAPAIDTVLRRAQISGRVEVGGEIKNHFADLLNESGSMIETVSLDARSYAALKNRWMRTRVESNT